MMEPVACECTKVEQDETCPVGYPSLLCEMCDGKGVVKSVPLDGTELWEIVFGIATDAADDITDEQYSKIAEAINSVFVNPTLVRLSDAEARIRELERERYELAYAITGGEDAPGLLDSVSVEQLVEIARGNHRSMSAEIDRSVAAEARAEAAEALLKEAGPIIKALRDIRSVWTDPHNDDICRAARAIHDKIGVKDE